MNFKELTVWVEAHPGESIVIGGAGLIALLWLLGYFSPTVAAPAQDPLAAAYYAAEAQQAIVGGQIQQTTLTTAAQTAQTGIQANAAVAINAAQTNAATTINGQNASAATTINQSLGNDALLATQSNNATSLATTQSNNATAITVNQANAWASEINNALNGIIPQELAAYGSATFALPGVGTVGATNMNAPSLSLLQSPAYGYSQEQALKAVQQATGWKF